MTGYNTILRIRRLEKEFAEFGLRMGHGKHGSYRQEFGDTIALMPEGDAFPIYCRDAEIFCGTLEEAEMWIRGFRKAREYDMMLFGVKHDEKRERKEQDVRNKKLLESLKEGKLADELIGGSPNGV